MGAAERRAESDGLFARRFRLLEEIGRGASAVVHRVADTLDDGRILALKTLRPDRDAGPAGCQRLREEFRAKVELQHPNTVAVVDLGEGDDGRPYLLMEHVAGSGLDELMAGGPLAVEQVCDLLSQLLLALGFVHGRHYLHRDVKPENVRVTPEGALKLMDFGQLQPLDDAAGGRLAGTIGYIAPEVLSPGPLDARVDLYAAGALAFELLTGRSAFADDPELGLRGCSLRRAPPLRALRPEIPEPLERLVLRLLEPDPAARPPSADHALRELCALEGGARAAASLDHKRCFLTTRQPVGREPELARLRERLRRALDAEPGSVFVAAPSGVGKSRLARELVLEAKLSGVLSLAARCAEDGMGPYAALSQLLTPLRAIATAGELARWGADLPGLGAAPAAPGLDKERLREALCGLLASVCRRRPVLLFVDDLQWADLQSVEALNHVIRELRPARLLVLATLRSDELPAGSPVWFTVADGASELLSIDPFDLQRTAALVGAMFPGLRDAGRLAEIVHRATAGNAFFVAETLRFLVQEGLLAQEADGWRFPAELAALEIPSTVEAILARRLARLESDERELAQLAAVVGPRQEEWLLAELSGFAPRRLGAALASLTGRQILATCPFGCFFAHDRVREALYRELNEPRRRQLHQRCGELLEQRAQDHDESQATRLAYHFDRGIDRHRSYRWCLEAGEQARRSGQDGIAIGWWSRAADALSAVGHSEKQELLFELWWKLGTVGAVVAPALACDALGRCIALMEAEGNLAAVARFIRLAVRLTPRSRLRPPDDTEPWRYRKRRGLARLLPPRPLLAWYTQNLQAQVWLCTAAAYAGRIETSLRAGERALELMPERAGPAEGAVLVGMACCRYMAGLGDEAAATIDRAERLLGAGPLQRWQEYFRAALGFVATTCAFQGIRPVAARLEQSLELSQRLGERSLRNAGYVGQAFWNAVTGRYREASERLDAAARNCREAATQQYMTLLLRPLLHSDRGEWQEALVLVERALRPDPSERVSIRILIESLHGELLLRLGRFEEADAALRQTLELSDRQGIPAGRIRAGVVFGELALAQGRLEEAERRLLEVWQMCAAGPSRNPLHQAIAARLLGDLHLARSTAGSGEEGRSAELTKARTRYEEALAISSSPEQDNLLEQGRLLRRLAGLDLAAGANEEARLRLERSRELFASIENRFELGLTEQQLARLAQPPPDAPEAPSAPAPARRVARTFEES